MSFGDHGRIWGPSMTDLGLIDDRFGAHRRQILGLFDNGFWGPLTTTLGPFDNYFGALDNKLGAAVGESEEPRRHA